MNVETKVTHTSGPWRLETVPTLVGHCHKIGPFPARPGSSRKETYACVYVDGLGLKPEDAPELLANARLIAASPDLLAKLKDIYSGMACSCRLQPLVGGPVPCETCQIGELIQKAEGR